MKTYQRENRRSDINIDWTGGKGRERIKSTNMKEQNKKEISSRTKHKRNDDDEFVCSLCYLLLDDDANAFGD